MTDNNPSIKYFRNLRLFSGDPWKMIARQGKSAAQIALSGRVRNARYAERITGKIEINRFILIILRVTKMSNALQKADNIVSIPCAECSKKNLLENSNSPRTTAQKE